MEYVIHRDEWVCVYSKTDHTRWSYQCGGDQEQPGIPGATVQLAASRRRAIVRVPARRDWLYVSTIASGRWRDLLETSDDILAELRPGLTVIGKCPYACPREAWPVLERRSTQWRLEVWQDGWSVMETEMTLPVYADTVPQLGYWFGRYKPEPQERVVRLSPFFWGRNRTNGKIEYMHYVFECDSRWGCHVQKWWDGLDVSALLLRLLPEYAPEVYAALEHDPWFTLPDEVDLGYYSITPDAIYRRFAGLRIDRLDLHADISLEEIEEFFHETAPRGMRLSFDQFGSIIRVYGEEGRRPALSYSIDRRKLTGHMPVTA